MDTTFYDDILTDEKEPRKKEIKLISKTTVSNKIKSKLLSYQEAHVIKLINILYEHGVALDNSDTGIGKTYAALAVAAEMGRRPFAICSKTTISNWKNVCDYIDVDYIDVVNYETIRSCKTYTDDRCKYRKRSKYIEKIDREDRAGNTIKSYKWKLPPDALLIIDEVHKCKNISTKIGELLYQTKQLHKMKNGVEGKVKTIPVLLLSATLCERVKDMKIIFSLFNLYPAPDNFNQYMRKEKRSIDKKDIQHLKSNPIKYEEEYNNKIALHIYDLIKPYSSRIRIRDLGDMFPENQWCAQQFIVDDPDELTEAYDEIAILKKAYSGDNNIHHLSKIQKLRQEIEIKKVSIFISQKR
jgi:superfamily II DNA or RNA helicase